METSNIINAIFTIIEETTKADQARIEKLWAKAEEVNNGLKPTKDSQGRLHAPCDGYIWGDDVFHGGSYLSEEYDFKHTPNNKTRLKVEAEQVEAIGKTFPQIVGGSGKTWNDSGINYCYLYLNFLTEAQAMAISLYSDNLAKEQREKVLAARGTIEEGKQALTVKVMGTFDRYNNYTKSHDLFLRLVDNNNVQYRSSITAKMWDLVDSNIEELINKTLSLTGTIKDLGNKEYKINRPSKIKLA